MRWIDIVLPSPGACPEFDRHAAHAAALLAGLPGLQGRSGLDAPAVTRCATEVGQALFQAVTAADPAAFRQDGAGELWTTPDLGAGEVDCLLGYHLVAGRDHLGLPWHWLHNGVEFVLTRAPLACAPHGSRVPVADPARLWMQRLGDDLFAPAAPVVPAASADRAEPEILFVAGHGDDDVRRLMFREADGIDAALQGAPRPLARLRMPGAVTPALLARRAMLYQGLHFTAPTSQHPSQSGAGEQRWLAGLIAAAGAPGLEAVANTVGLELEVLGVDPIDALLDQVTEPPVVAAGSAVARSAASRDGHATPIAQTGALGAGGWLLDDGPFLPEDLGSEGTLPPLVFSNSYCSLAGLGSRFLDAGASTFVGTAAPLYSRPARRFAAWFYTFLAEGLWAATALRAAALAMRDEFGADHPAWLAYGLLGYGSLSLRHL